MEDRRKEMIETVEQYWEGLIPLDEMIAKLIHIATTEEGKNGR